MNRAFKGMLCVAVVLAPAAVWGQDPANEAPAASDPALAAAVRALVSTVSALSAEIRRQRDEIDRLNKEVATMKKDARDAGEGAEPGDPTETSNVARPAPKAGQTLEEQLELLRAGRLKLIEETALLELKLIDEIAAADAGAEGPELEERAARADLLQKQLEQQKRLMQVATAKIGLLQKYIAARDDLDAADPSLIEPLEGEAPKNNADEAPAPQ